MAKGCGAAGGRLKRIGNLWPELVSWPNLTTALHRAGLGKRNRPDVGAFLLDWEPRLIALQRELIEGAYVPGPYRTFMVREPKPRRISAAPFRDRVVHHALTQVLEPVFERRFVPQSYACRKGWARTRRSKRRPARVADFLTYCSATYGNTFLR